MQVRWALLVVLIVAGGLTACSSLTGSSEIDTLETQNAQYRGTIEVMGTPMLTIAALEQQAAQNVVLQAQLQAAQGTLTELELRSAQATLTMVAAGGGPAETQPNPNADAPQVTPGPVNTNQTPGPLITSPGPATAAPAPAGDNATRFSQTVTATGRDAQDCAQGVTAVFEPTTPTIYVVTRINRLTAGSVIGARWTANGELYFDDVECWIPQQNYVDICAYCSIVPDGTAFETGQWSVELLLDSQVLSQVQFQVRDPNAADAAAPAGTPAAATPATPADWKGND